MMAKVTIHWHGYTETVVTSVPFKCHGGVAWITPLEDHGLGPLPYPYDQIECERV